MDSCMEEANMSSTASDLAEWPGTPYAPDAADFIRPLQAVLKELHVLEDTSEKEQRSLTKTPFSYEVITAGAMTFSRNWSVIIGALGGVGAITSAIKAAGYGSSQPIQAATFTASAAFLLAATVVAIAIMVKADVQARGAASSAQYAARASITSAMLASSRYGRPVAQPNPTPPPPASNYLVEVGGKWYPVNEFKQTAKGVVADLIGRDDDVPVSQVKGITTSSVWQK
jgi:hypothetical protein